MAKLTKKQKEAASKIEKNKLYSLKDASSLLKTVASAKFDESVDIAVRLGVDPRKANQMVRGVVTLPHGTGKDVRVLALVTPDKEAEAKAVSVRSRAKGDEGVIAFASFLERLVGEVKTKALQVKKVAAAPSA